MNHRQAFRICHKFPCVKWILLFLSLLLGLSFLSGCGTKPTVTVQTTQNTQPLISSEFFSTYEFEMDEKNWSQCLLSDEHCFVLSVSLSSDYLAALERMKNDPLQITPSDESGNPIYPDFEIRSYHYTGEFISTIDLSAFSSSLFQPLLAVESDGSIAALSRQVDFRNGAVLAAITVFNVDGEKKAAINKIPLDPSIVFVTHFGVDNSGNYYVVGTNEKYEQSISIISASGKLIGMHPLGDIYPEELLLASNGIYIISTRYDMNSGCTTIATPIYANLRQ